MIFLKAVNLDIKLSCKYIVETIVIQENNPITIIEREWDKLSTLNSCIALTYFQMTRHNEIKICK